MRRFPLVLFALALAVPASAQSIWLDREHRPSILAEVLFPDFEGETDFPTWAWFVAGKLPGPEVGSEKRFAEFGRLQAQLARHEPGIAGRFPVA